MKTAIRQLKDVNNVLIDAKAKTGLQPTLIGQLYCLYNCRQGLNPKFLDKRPRIKNT